MRKNIAKLVAAALVFSTLFTSAAFAQGWEKQNNGKWYYWQEDGTVAKNQWIYDIVETAVTDEAGNIQPVTITNRYWVGNDGIMVTDQWLPEGDKWHYVDKKGLEVKNQLLKPANTSQLYYIDAEGNMVANGWCEWDGEKYYFQADGTAVRGKWYNVNGDDYYFLKSGKMAYDCTVPGGGHVGADGKRTK